MKNFGFFLIFAMGFVPLYGQVTIFPNVREQSIPDIYIRKVEISDFYTKLHFYYHPRTESYVCADKSFHIAPSGTRDARYMITAKNIPICPEREKITMYEEDLEFEIWFPKLPENIYKIDVVESPQNGFNFYGVTINNGQQKPLPDTSNMREREAFKEYFEQHAGDLNLIEGIWQVHETLDHYGYDQVVDKKYKEHDYELAILKEGKRYLVYHMDGTPVEAEYVDVAGGRGKYFKKYFRDLNETVTTYVENLSDEGFELKYQLPGRMAMEELLENYVPGDRIFVSLVFSKQIPPVPGDPDKKK